MLRKLSNVLRWILWPISVLYGIVTYIRNYLYNNELKKIYLSELYTINIGNLTVGGTGKTPHIEYLQQLLSHNWKISVLSRGYGRKTTGYREVRDQSTALEVGDEPLQFYHKFGHQTPVFVCEKRVEGILRIEKEKPNTQIILLDDAFQHRAIRPHLNLLLTDYRRLFYQDYVLPMGLLREFRLGAKRANAVIVTKCPQQLSETDKNEIVRQIQKFTLPSTPVFFSTFRYGTPVPYFNHLPLLIDNQPISLISGIAQPLLFEEAASAIYKVIGHNALGDHHNYSEEDVWTFAKMAQKSPILTTEKDWVKLFPLLEKMGLQEAQFYYWPIQVGFDSPTFDQYILNEVAKQSRV
ncbi:tetraacyldisaccharide 4'-kinase [Runella rosea]|uniref:Tetraacyldisaccharide 4'-kinase n=1 Tax=Runella rosea TaxID=2259595 RepID=A0A344TCS4_9BACT|nr:tetraacyldisaccharide 4'-kinase [Runella rosea]AXE16445.1 tetraacyldisaccharide 4'-kinase [Runella rosea]